MTNPGQFQFIKTVLSALVAQLISRRMAVL